MFDFTAWQNSGFSFTRDGMEFYKEVGESSFYVDNCEHEVDAEERDSHDLPILIAWLAEARLIVITV